MKTVTARDLMTCRVVFAEPDARLAVLAQFLDGEEIHGAPVVDGSGRLVGMVSRSDLARALAEEILEGPPPQSREEADDGAEDDDDDDRDDDDDSSAGVEPEAIEPVASLTVRDVMSTDVVTADEGATAGALAELMRTHGVHRVVITSRDTVLGIVSITDLLQVVTTYEALLVVAPRGARAKVSARRGGAG